MPLTDKHDKGINVYLCGGKSVSMGHKRSNYFMIYFIFYECPQLVVFIWQAQKPMLHNADQKQKRLTKWNAAWVPEVK